MGSNAMDIDEVFERIGQFGPYQIKLFFALNLLVNAAAAFQMIQNVFVGAQPSDFTCVSLQKGKYFRHAGCANTTLGEKCISYEHQETYTSIATEWNLYCDKSYLVSLVQSVFMAGVLVGALLFGQLSDRVGRVKAFFIGTAILLVFALAGAFAPNIQFYMAMRFFAGVGNQGIILCSFVLTAELIGASKRVMVGCFFPAIFAIGIAIYALIASFIQTWAALTVVCVIPLVPIAALYWYLPESPRWLLTQDRVTEAEDVLKKIAIGNGCEFPAEKIRLKPPEKKSHKSKGGHSAIDLIKEKALRGRTLIQVYSWFVNSAVYYGLTMGAGSLGSNMYISLALSGLVEIPAYVVTILILDRIGRRYCLCGFMVIGGIACFSILFVPATFTHISTGLALTGKLSIAASFSVIYIYSTELYPTVVRNVGLGVCSMAARVGGILAPAILPMGSIYPNLQYVVFGLLSFTAGLLNMGLPETGGKPLLETIEDLDNKTVSKALEVPVGDALSEDRVRLLEQAIHEDEEEEDEETRLM